MSKSVTRSIISCILLALPLAGCSGIFSDFYDEPPSEDGKQHVTSAGELYIDASSWTEWHFINLDALAEVSDADSIQSSWTTYPISIEQTSDTESDSGIYTYWYDVFGTGISKREFRDFYPARPQRTPENWTFAVHRNNAMTNGCSVASTDFDSFDQLPDDRSALYSLDFKEDSWNESDVWVIQDRMLLGLIGSQGIAINECLSSWLSIDIPPMPPAFTLNSNVFILKTREGRLAALQLKNYQSASGTKCVLSINYRYPL